MTSDSSSAQACGMAVALLALAAGHSMHSRRRAGAAPTRQERLARHGQALALGSPQELISIPGAHAVRYDLHSVAWRSAAGEGWASWERACFAGPLCAGACVQYVLPGPGRELPGRPSLYPGGQGNRGSRSCHTRGQPPGPQCTPHHLMCPGVRIRTQQPLLCISGQPPCSPHRAPLQAGWPPLAAAQPPARRTW